MKVKSDQRSSGEPRGQVESLLGSDPKITLPVSLSNC